MGARIGPALRCKTHDGSNSSRAGGRSQSRCCSGVKFNSTKTLDSVLIRRIIAPCCLKHGRFRPSGQIHEIQTARDRGNHRHRNGRVCFRRGISTPLGGLTPRMGVDKRSKIGYNKSPISMRGFASGKPGQLKLDGLGTQPVMQKASVDFARIPLTERKTACKIKVLQ